MAKRYSNDVINSVKSRMTTNTVNRIERNERFKDRLGIIGVIFLIIFIIAFARQLIGAEPLTFTSFLHTISSLPDVTVSTLIDYSIAGSWGLFDFLRIFINSMISVVNVLVYIGSLLYNLIVLLFHCVKFLLGF